MGWEIGNVLFLPKIPPNYVGYHIKMSLTTIGGYGAMTTGMYDVKAKGYRPYGALGQGPDPNRAVVYEQSLPEHICVPRTTKITVIPKGRDFKLEADESVKFELRSTGFRIIDWAQPPKPESPDKD